MCVCWMSGLWWGSPSGPSLPLALTPGPSPAQRERGDVSIAWNGFGWCLGGWREWWFLRGSLSFCEGALRFLRGAWAVHERPLRGAFSFLVGVLVVWVVLAPSFGPWSPHPRWRPLRNCRVSEHWKIDVVVQVFVGGCLPCPALLSAPVALTLALSRRAGEGIRPVASPGFAMLSLGGIFAQLSSEAFVALSRRCGPLCPSDVSPASGGNPGVLCPSDVSSLDFVLFGGGNPVARPQPWVPASVFGVRARLRVNDVEVCGGFCGESVVLRRGAGRVTDPPLPAGCVLGVFVRKW